MNLYLILPILIPLMTAILLFLTWRWRRVQRGLGVAGAAALFVAGLGLLTSVQENGIQAAQMGNWPAPFGITLVADLFSAIMVALVGLIGLAVAVYSVASIDTSREAFGYYAFFHILLMGVCGAFLTGDIFNLYVWFEVMLIASFVLLALGGERAQLEGAIKYVTLNLVSSALFLTAVGILYGVAGTLNMADLALNLHRTAQPGMVTTLAILFFVAFGIKAAVFPLFFWLPASYHTPPVAVSAIFAGLLTKVGIYAMIRVFTLLFIQEPEYTHRLILLVAGLTMIAGVLGALAQTDFRRALAFQHISHVGYMMMGLGLYTGLALAGSVFYIIHHVIVKTNLFLITGVTQRLKGSFDLRKLGGLYRAHPGVALLFFIPAFSLAGVPPLSGFFAKLALIKAGLDAKEYAIVATALGVGLLTLLVMARIWAEAFWKPAPVTSTSSAEEVDGAAASEPGGLRTLLAPIILLAVLTVIVGLVAEPVFALATRAAQQLMNPTEYIQAVLGGRS
ncbi:MAG TPA: Na+/H+ antiporter subunit D [Terriglobia bacterium]|nr:Na+/H+ antiporter subunit D [Terriglobia bacterium]